MAFSRKKPVPARRGRLRKETTVTETTEVSGEPTVVEAPVEAEEAVTEETTTTRRTTKPAVVVTEKAGLEMALVVVTLITLIAAFALIQLGMHKAFGVGWPF